MEFEIENGWIRHNCDGVNTEIGGILEFKTTNTGYTTVRCRFCGKEWSINEFLRKINIGEDHEG